MARNKLDETDWYKKHQNPVRVGCYRTRFTTIRGGRDKIEGFSWWNGAYWSNQRNRPQELHHKRKPGSSPKDIGAQNKEWKGIRDYSVKAVIAQRAKE